MRAEMCGWALEVSWSRFPRNEVENQFRMGTAALTGAAEERLARVLLGTGYGQALEQYGAVDEARALFAEVQGLVAELDDPRLEAQVRVAASRSESTAGAFDAALDLLLPAVAYFERAGDLAGAAEAQGRLAMAYAEQFRIEPALAADLEPLRLHAAMGNRPRVAVSELNVGASYVLCGAWDIAERYTADALAHLHELDDHGLDPYTWCQQAEIHAGRGEHEEAERLFSPGIARLRQLDDQAGLRLKLVEWGRFLTEVGRHEQAILVLGEAADVWRASGGNHFVLTARAAAARARAGLGDAAGAVELAGEVWEAIDGRDAVGLPYPVESIADCARALGPGDPRLALMRALGRQVVDSVAGELADPGVQAAFLALPDVRFVSS